MKRQTRRFTLFLSLLQQRVRCFIRWLDIRRRRRRLNRPDFPRCEIANFPSLFLLSSLASLSHSALSNLDLPIPVSTSTLDMATSSSAAPPSALGECVVCGKESSTRCSSCAKGGLDWMFFCSREHQKLVSANSGIA